MKRLRYMISIMIVTSFISRDSLSLQDAQLKEPPVSYSRQILPILRLRCAGCHSTRNKWWKQFDGPERGFDVSTHESLMKGGERGAAIVPGNPAKSRLVKHLQSNNIVIGSEYTRMPFVGRPLPKEQIELIKRWIKQGAAKDALPPQVTRVTLNDVSLRESKKADERVHVICRIPVECYATIVVRDAKSGKLLERRGGTVQKLRPEAEEDLGSATTANNWLYWQINPLRTGVFREEHMPDLVSIDLVIEHNEEHLWGTEFGIRRGTHSGPARHSFAIPNPVSITKQRALTFNYRLDADADVDVQIDTLQSRSPNPLFADRKVDLRAGLKTYPWNLKDNNGKHVKPTCYVARFRCKTRNTRIPVNDVCIVFRIDK